MAELRIGGLYKIIQRSRTSGLVYRSSGQLTARMNNWSGDHLSQTRYMVKYNQHFLLLAMDAESGYYKILVDDFIGWVGVWEDTEELIEVIYSSGKAI